MGTALSIETTTFRQKVGNTSYVLLKYAPYMDVSRVTGVGPLNTIVVAYSLSWLSTPVQTEGLHRDCYFEF